MELWELKAGCDDLVNVSSSNHSPLLPLPKDFIRTFYHNNSTSPLFRKGNWCQERFKTLAWSHTAKWMRKGSNPENFTPEVKRDPQRPLRRDQGHLRSPNASHLLPNTLQWPKVQGKFFLCLLFTVNLNHMICRLIPRWLPVARAEKETHMALWESVVPLCDLIGEIRKSFPEGVMLDLRLKSGTSTGKSPEEGKGMCYRGLKNGQWTGSRGSFRGSARKGVSKAPRVQILGKHSLPGSCK